MMVTKTAISEVEIMKDLVVPKGEKFSPEAARQLLKIKFSRTAQARIQKLLGKNNRGTITEKEKETLDSFLRVGQLLDWVHAKAWYSLSEE
jgi:hypothetical protein